MLDAAFVGLNSSALARVAYDESRQHLHIEFRDGSAYVYRGVTATVYRELLTAESQGGYFNRKIRNAYVSAPPPS
ncbi:MAG TPA: KTSC domain-containing protein [Bryobacteraceae bacterium]|nr:KTSC domain-containing protein [Bryobacteraceae bacterium]